jgi:CheY-like chemotaxis protein
MLPASATPLLGAVPPATARSEVSQNVSLDSLRLLVVEDEPATLEFLKQMLESYGAVVTAVSSAQAALEAFRTNPPDILVSDIGLPDVDGYDLMQRIRQSDLTRGRTIPAIALTAYARSEDRTQAFLAGYQAHIVKPAEPSELIATIASFARLIRRPSAGAPRIVSARSRDDAKI